jgi:hypothetical protein
MYNLHYEPITFGLQISREITFWAYANKTGGYHLFEAYWNYSKLLDALR